MKTAGKMYIVVKYLDNKDTNGTNSLDPFVITGTTVYTTGKMMYIKDC